MSVQTITLGCRFNFAESETLARSAPFDEDWIVVNSCAVTNEAVRQTRQAIRRAHRQWPDAQIMVTGCASELDPKGFATMPGVSRVPTNEVMIINPRIREMILKGEDSKLLDAIRANYNEGMVDFNENLRQLVELNRIDKSTALEFSPNADQLRMMLKGIKVAASGLV